MQLQRDAAVLRRCTRALVLACLVACAGGPERSSVGGPRSVLEDRVRASTLSADIAVRHRRVATSWQDIVAVVSDDGGSSAPPVATAPAPPAAAPEQLVVELWLQLQIDDVPKTVAAIDERVTAAGGRVVSSSVEGTASAALVLRLPPARAPDLATWLAGQGTIESRRSLATDVSRTLFDRALELRNLQVTMTRLEALAARDLPLGEVLAVEKELTRVRGEIERVEGEQRFLADRVELATINITLTHEGGPVELAHARVYPGARLASLTLLDPGARRATRLGGGASLRLSRLFTLDLELFPRTDGDSRAILATIGSALYSDYFGAGRRRFGNPYLGARVGYGYLSGEGGMVVAAEVGVELYRQSLIVVEIAARALALAHDSGTDAGFEGLVGASIPF